MEDIKFSVIIPVYNAEKFLDACILSVLKQSYNNFEVIIIDDGSTDESRGIYKKFEKNDKRVKSFKVENGGPFRAREIGISKASGDYCLFIDSDDQFADNAFSTIEENIKRYEADCVIFRYAKVKEGKTIYTPCEEIQHEYSREDMFSKVLFSSSYNSMCRKAIKKELLLDGVNYEKYYHIRNAEDLIESLRVYINANKIIFINNELYLYNQLETSNTHQFKYKNITDSFETHEYILEQIDNKRLFDEKGKYNYILSCLKILSYQIRTVIDSDLTFTEKSSMIDRMKEASYCKRILTAYSFKALPLRDSMVIRMFIGKKVRLLTCYREVELFISKEINSRRHES